MTKLVCIVNVTPDSFSGDGLVEVSQVLAQIDRLIEEGADVIDIGAESTRPNATPISAKEEWGRLEPVIKALGARTSKLLFSIDTRHAATAEKVLQHGFDWINDVSGASDSAMLDVIRDTDCKYVLMHSLSVPADANHVIASIENPTEVVMDWAKEKIKFLEQAGIKRSRIIFDPGIGFGKTAEQSLALCKDIAQFKTLGMPVLVGHSRKSFLKLFSDIEDPSHDRQTLLLSSHFISQGIDYLRVHNVKQHRHLIAMQKDMA